MTTLIKKKILLRKEVRNRKNKNVDIIIVVIHLRGNLNRHRLHQNERVVCSFSSSIIETEGRAAIISIGTT
jgi:hypothetical protein